MSAAWRTTLSGPIVWAAHFLAVYAIGEFWGDATAPRIAVAAVTIVTLAALAWLAKASAMLPDTPGFDRWRRTTTRVGLLLAAIAVVWQALPAAF